MAIYEIADSGRRGIIRDQSTGLLNRRGLQEIGRELMALGRRFREPITCTVVDIDGQLNVTTDAPARHESEAIEVATLLVPAFRESDAFARWDVARFAVLALGSGPRPENIERRLRDHLSSVGSGDDIQISSGQVVKLPEHDETVDELVQRAFALAAERYQMPESKFGDDLE